MGRKLICCSLGLALVVIATLCSVARGTDYKDALSKSILYYEAQRSGPLPAQRVTWRADSGLQDGKAQGIDLTGGYYDAGDNVKFGLPMAFTATMLAWSVVEYRAQLAAQGELQHALEAIKWATDYFIKAHPEPNVLYGEVGDGESDHLCWMRPEDMTTPRVAYKIDTENPGSDLAGETAAALAAAAIVFKRANPSYSGILLTHAKQLFSFADTYRGKYDYSINVVRNFYASRSGYADELLWAAIWLYKATGEEFYLKYVADNAGSLGGSSWSMKEFSWDVKYAGVQVLVSQILLGGKGGYHADIFKQYQQKAEYFLCAQLQGNYGADNTDRTPGGLLYVRQWNNMQYVSAASFLLAVYSDSLPPTGQVHCPARAFTKAQLFSLAKSQADYILGHNPRSTSYMVGFGTSYAKHVHHRGASIVSYKENRALVGCKQGYSNWYSRSLPNPNILVGALVGGPDENDNFADERTNYEQTEPATYNNGPLVGLLARLAGTPYGSQSADVKPPASSGKPKPSSPKRTPAPAPPKPKTRPIPPPKKPAPKLAPKPGRKPAPKPGKKPAPKPAPKPSPKPAPKPGKKPSPKPYVPVKLNILITQKKDATWHADGKVYNKYVATVTNKSKKSVKELVIRIKGYSGDLYGLTKIGKGSNWVLPKWGQVLAPGQSYSFIIVQAAPPPVIVVRKYVVA